MIFPSFKIKNLTNVNDSVPGSLRSCVVCKFTCEGYNFVYVGEARRQNSTRFREHLFTDTIHTLKHLQSSEDCKDSCSDRWFKVSK